MKYLDYLYFLLSRNTTKNLPMLHRNGYFLIFMQSNVCTLIFLLTWTVTVWMFIVIFVAVTVFVELVYDEADYKRLRKIEARYKDMPADIVHRKAVIAQILAGVSVIVFIVMANVILMSKY